MTTTWLSFTIFLDNLFRKSPRALLTRSCTKATNLRALSLLLPKNLHLEIFRLMRICVVHLGYIIRR
jgi:hypothetical protein